MSRKYKFAEKDGAYFVSFATVYWIDVFTRIDYFDTIIESLDYCRKNKGMEIYGYCIMPSHIHLIFRSGNGKPSELIRDFKGFTSRNLLKTIQEDIYNKALSYREKHITKVDSYDEFKKVLEEKGGFISAHWDGTDEEEEQIKNETKATIRCIPLDNILEEGVSLISGKKSTQRVIFAKAY